MVPALLNGHLRPPYDNDNLCELTYLHDSDGNNNNCNNKIINNGGIRSTIHYIPNYLSMHDIQHMNHLSNMYSKARATPEQLAKLEGTKGKHNTCIDDIMDIT